MLCSALLRLSCAISSSSSVLFCCCSCAAATAAASTGTAQRCPLCSSEVEHCLFNELRCLALTVLYSKLTACTRCFFQHRLILCCSSSSSATAQSLHAIES